MYVNEKLKLNKFRAVKCPTKKELFSRVGNVSQNIDAFTGDELSRMGQNKTDEFANAETMIRHRKAEPKDPETAE